MTLEYEPGETINTFDHSPVAPTELRGRKLFFSRMVWAVLVVLSLTVFIFCLPDYIAQLHTLCRVAQCAPASGQLTTGVAQALRDQGISVDMYATYTFILELATALIWFIIGGVIFWRKSKDGIVLLVSLMLILMGTANVSRTFYGSHSAWHLPVLFLNQLTFVVFFLVFALFPNGRFVPGWMRWLVLGFAVEGVLAVFFPFVPSVLGVWSDPVSGLLWFGLSGSVLFSQIYRYRNVSNPVQRQQTKWVLFSIIVLLTGDFSVWLLGNIFPSLSLTQNSLLYETASNFTLLLIPLSISIAILRYRLWDIDIIINRTLVYGSLTSILLLVYFGLVITLQFLVSMETDQIAHSPLIIVGSTLTIAALFQPLRHQIQAIIDRRFYRRKYDAARTLESFNKTLRDEMDIEELRERLVAVVQETMQPAFVTLWLRQTERQEKALDDGLKDH